MCNLKKQLLIAVVNWVNVKYTVSLVTRLYRSENEMLNKLLVIR